MAKQKNARAAVNAQDTRCESCEGFAPEVRKQPAALASDDRRRGVSLYDLDDHLQTLKSILSLLANAAVDQALPDDEDIAYVGAAAMKMADEARLMLSDMCDVPSVEAQP